MPVTIVSRCRNHVTERPLVRDLPFNASFDAVDIWITRATETGRLAFIANGAPR